MLMFLLFGCCTRYALALSIDYQIFKDVIELPLVNQCDIGYVYEHGNGENLIELLEVLPKMRTTMVRSVRGNMTQADTLPNLNKCIVHILDLNINLTKEYLISIWNPVSIGSQNFYFIKIEETDDLDYLNFSKIFDFQRVAIAKSFKFQPNVRQIIQPNELASDVGFFVSKTAWTSNTGFHPKNAIFTSPFNDFEGRVVNVVLPNVTTFSLTFTYPDGSKVRSGPDYLAAYYISAALNFELREMDIADGPWSWGYLVNKTTNSFNGMIGMVQKREAQLAMGIITLTPQRDTAVDFSYPYFFNRLGFISKKPGPLSKLTAILWPYQTFVWITMALSVPFFALIFWTFLNLQEEGRGIKLAFGLVLLEVSQLLVMQGIEQRPMTWKCRILLLFWAIFAFVVASAYQGNLMAMLTLPARSKAIDTFSDILELPDEATVGVFQWSSMNEILQETSDPTLQAVNKRMKKQGTQRTHDIPEGYDDDPFEFVIKSPTPVAWIMDVDSTKISIGASHTTLSGQTDMHFSSELMNPSWYCYAMRKYSPFKENVNKWVRRFAQFGLNLKWYENAKIDRSNWRIAMRKSGKPAPPVEVDFSDTPELEPLTLLPLQGPLTLHALILVLASLAWLAELFACSRQERDDRVVSISQFKVDNYDE